MPDDTTVIVQSNEQPEPNDPDVAAVAAGASGVALSESLNAQQTAAQAGAAAQEATAAAQEATEVGIAAQIEAMSVAERLDRLEKLTLMRAMQDEQATVAPAVEAAPALEPVSDSELGPPEQEPPKSVGGKKKRTFRESWEGTTGE